MGVCPSRKSVTAVPTGLKGKINSMDTKVAGTTYRQAQTKNSWSRLREEAALNPDATPFFPPQPTNQASQVAPKRTGGERRQPEKAQPLRTHTLGKVPNTVPTAVPTISPLGQEADAEWMQYLSKRLNFPNSASESPVHAKKFSSTRAQRVAPGPTHSQSTQPAANVASDVAGAAPGFVLRTDEYMRLLKAGNCDSKRGPAAKPLPYSSGVARVTKNLSSTATSGGDGTKLSSECLGKLWSNAFSPTEVPTLEREFVQKKFALTDDTFVERMSIDRDISEEMYWSDGGDGKFGTLSPSAHKFRQPPQVASRSYVMQDLSDEVDEGTAMVLRRVQRFNDNLKDCGPDRSAYRRFIIGLKEVFRRLKQGHVAALIVAPDIQGETGHGGLDDRMREVLAYAMEHDVPVIFALSRRRIGRALGKSLNISILGIIDLSGAQDLWDKVQQLVHVQRESWLNRRALK